MKYNSLKTYWYNLSDKLRFLLVGGFNAVCSYVIYSLLIYFILGENLYQISLALSWIISSVISFTTQRILVFPGQGSIIKQYLKCCITWFFSYLINAFLLCILVEKIAINVYLGQIFATMGCAVFTYVMFKIFAFKDNRENF